MLTSPKTGTGLFRSCRTVNAGSSRWDTGINTPNSSFQFTGGILFLQGSFQKNPKNQLIIGSYSIKGCIWMGFFEINRWWISSELYDCTVNKCCWLSNCSAPECVSTCTNTIYINKIYFIQLLWGDSGSPVLTNKKFLLFVFVLFLSVVSESSDSNYTLEISKFTNCVIFSHVSKSAMLVKYLVSQHSGQQLWVALNPVLLISAGIKHSWGESSHYF